MKLKHWAISGLAAGILLACTGDVYARPWPWARAKFKHDPQLFISSIFPR